MVAGVPRWRQLILDRWANLGFKEPLDNPHQWTHTWVSVEDQRRLAAYRVLAAYLENSARELLRHVTVAEKREYREYGDADLIVGRIVAGIVGDSMEIAVEGADTEPPDTPVVPDKPAEPGPDADPIARRTFEAAMQVWETRAEEAIADWEAQWAALPALQAHQDWLRTWADSELLEQAVWECESDAVGLGDGVYVLSLSTEQQRPKIDLYDPGMYFPVLDENARRRGFPTKIHIAFETDENGDGQPDHVRRLTWELAPIEGARLAPDRNGNPGVIVTTADGRMVPRLAGDAFAPDGGLQRRYPWAKPDETSNLTCYHSDATWALSDLAGHPVDGFPESAARYAVNEDGQQLRRLDLQIDFVPVVHVPNTPARRDHFGRSSLGRGLQLLDDLAAADSDLVAASALAGTPMVAVSGENTVTAEIHVKPGAAYGLGAHGRMDVIDLSASVVALQGVISDLLERVSVNFQLPGEILGRVDDTGPESGFARLLKLGPYESLIGLLRLVRDPKYQLLLRFAARLAQAGGFMEPGETPPARLVFGSFLPADRTEAITNVVALLQARGVSRRTALQLLVEVGIDVGDLAEELARIDADDIESAQQLFEATGDESLVLRRLGLPDEPSARPPMPTLPPAGPIPPPPVPPAPA